MRIFLATHNPAFLLGAFWFFIYGGLATKNRQAELEKEKTNGPAKRDLESKPNFPAKYICQRALETEGMSGEFFRNSLPPMMENTL